VTILWELPKLVSDLASETHVDTKISRDQDVDQSVDDYGVASPPCVKRMSNVTWEEVGKLLESERCKKRGKAIRRDVGVSIRCRHTEAM
jgi:hypothetical protein